MQVAGARTSGFHYRGVAEVDDDLDVGVTAVPPDRHISTVALDRLKTRTM